MDFETLMLTFELMPLMEGTSNAPPGMAAPTSGSKTCAIKGLIQGLAIKWVAPIIAADALRSGSPLYPIP